MINTHIEDILKHFFGSRGYRRLAGSRAVRVYILEPNTVVRMSDRGYAVDAHGCLRRLPPTMTGLRR